MMPKKRALAKPGGSKDNRDEEENQEATDTHSGN